MARIRGSPRRAPQKKKPDEGPSSELASISGARPPARATPDQILDFIRSQDDAMMDLARSEVLKLYTDLDLTQLVTFLSGAIGLSATQGQTLRKALELFDYSVRVLNDPPAVVGQIIRVAVADQRLSTDQLITALDPRFSFNQYGKEQLWAERRIKRFNEFWQKESPRFRQDVHRLVKKGLRHQWDEDRLANEIQQATGVSRYRAVRIARNEVIGARAYANQERQRDLGLEEYVWTTQRDSRVRPEHQKRDRKKYRWDAEGPKPGSEILCRCYAKPFIPADRLRR